MKSWCHTHCVSNSALNGGTSCEALGEEGSWAICYQTDSEGAILVNAEHTAAQMVVHHGAIHLHLAEDASEASFLRFQAKRRLAHRCNGPQGPEWPAGYEECC
jgi:hypothetical protein